MFRRSQDLDPRTADRLLEGTVNADDAPPGYRQVAALLAAAATPAAACDADSAVLAGMTEAVGEGSTATPLTHRRTQPVVKKLLTAKAAAVFGVVALSTTGAAAATGNLPDAAQDGLSKAASHIGVNLPDSADDKARAATTKDHGKPPDVADEGDVANDANDANDHGETVSETARTTEAEGREKGEVVSETARDGHGPDSTGKPVETPAPVDTPNDGEGSNGSSNAADKGGNADDHPTPEDNPGTGRRP